jgi:multicomponent Na+:H+ antiporter subunit E
MNAKVEQPPRQLSIFLRNGMSESVPPQHTPINRGKRMVRRLTQWVLLFGLWLALSGVFLGEFMVIGAITAAIAVGLSERLFQGTHEGFFSSAPPKPFWFVTVIARLVLYIPWLSLQVIFSNLHVVLLVLNPRMPIDPTLVGFDTTLTSESAQVVLAQSITLTPGTVTVDASNGRFLIHCLSRKTRQGIADGDIQTKVAKVFSEPWVEEVTLTDIVAPGQVPL